MRPSFLALPRPAVACIQAASRVDEALATIRNGEFDGADAFAIHLRFPRPEMLTRENLAGIAASTKKPVMFLLYRGDAQWPCAPTDEDRAEVMALAIEAGGAAVDITGDMFDESPLEITRKSEAVEKQMRFIERIHRLGGEIVLSSHIAQARSLEQVVEHLLTFEKRGADYVKIVTKADTEAEFVEAVETTLALRHALKTPFIHLCGGEFARPHRFLAPTLGCALTFCVERYTPSFTTAQPPLRAMKSVLGNVQWHIDQTIPLDRDTGKEG